MGRLRSGRVHRTATLSALMARRAAGLVATRVRGAAATDRRRRELDEQFAIRSADDVAAQLGSMKGAAMKLGQMLSYQIEGLPPAAQRSLASLQADVAPMAPSLAEQVVLDSVGRHPTELFVAWNPVPVASASIGQVHRAVRRDGREVAVKVQYPGVADAITADLANAKWLHRMVSVVALKRLDIDALVTELRDRMAEEVDYRLEAERQARFAARYHNHPFLHVPSVHRDISSDRVLVTDWADGATWTEYLSSASAAQRQLTAEAIFRFVQGALYRFREFNADPHPGNYRFGPDGRVTLLDFGLVKSWTDAEVETLWPLIDPLLAQDRELTIRRAEAAGFLAPDHGLSIDQIWEYVSLPYRPFLTERFAFTPSFTQQTLSTMVDVSGPHVDVLNQLSMPASFVLLDRVVWGLTALLGQLGAENCWRAILAEYRQDAAPATGLGADELAWRNASHTEP